jgi:hypothetical protein
MTEATGSVERSAAKFFANFLGDASLLEALEDGRGFRYEPKPDITTYELALCVYLLIAQVSPDGGLRAQQKIYDLLPATAQRHFKVVRDDDDA